MPAPANRVRIDPENYPEPDMVARVDEDGEEERGYLVVCEDGTVRFDPQYPERRKQD